MPVTGPSSNMAKTPHPCPSDTLPIFQIREQRLTSGKTRELGSARMPLTGPVMGQGMCWALPEAQCGHRVTLAHLGQPRRRQSGREDVRVWSLPPTHGGPWEQTSLCPD